MNNLSIFKINKKNKLIGYSLIEERALSIDILKIYVMPKFRMKGFGNILLDKILMYAKENNFTVTLDIYNESDDFIKKWYEKNKFVFSGNTGLLNNFPESFSNDKKHCNIFFEKYKSTPLPWIY